MLGSVTARAEASRGMAGRCADGELGEREDGCASVALTACGKMSRDAR